MKATFLTLLLMAGIFLAAQEPVQITFDPASDWDAYWSPDGNFMCFTSNRSGPQEIWKMTATGDSSIQLTFDNANNMHSCWSPVKDSIAYDSEKSGNQDVWVLPVDGDDHIQITTHLLRDESLSWNHDGTEICFDSNRSGGNWDIWKKPVSGGSAVRLTNHTTLDVEPSVSPNGEKIAFISFRSGDCDIWMMDYDGNNEEQLTFNSYFEGGICWSPDGEFLAYSANNLGNNDIWILPVAGGLPMQFTTHTASDMYPSWSPDGSLIAFTSNRSGNNDIWKKEFSSWLYLGQIPPGLIPERFPPDYLLGNEDWFWHGPPVFSPNGQELFMSRYYPAGNGDMLIYFMEVIGQEWTTPETPAFCYDYNANSPAYTFGGDTIFYVSWHPEASYNFSIKNGSNWSDPIEVSIPIPAQASYGNSISVAKNRTLYFELDIAGNLDLYKSEFVNGQYLDAINLGPAINSSDLDFSPFVDPDEQFIIFSSNRSSGFGYSDLYISTKTSIGEWSTSQNLGNLINSENDDFGPFVTNNGDYFFFCTSKDDDIGYNPYWVDTEVLDPFLIIGIDNTIHENINNIFPNPFKTSTSIEYEVKKCSKVSLKIYNLQGIEVKTLINSYQTPGIKTIVWDGTSSSGQTSPSGVYYCRIQVGDEVKSLKINKY